jgi:acetylornithine deacetylase/succinyl-diaminopimelate desuccinylase-like protein
MPLLLQPKLADYLLDVLGRVNAEQSIAMNAMLRNTCSPTMLDAGKKVNVIPSAARAQVDGRVLPGQTIAQFLDEVRRVVGNDVELNVKIQHEAVTFPSDTPLFDAIERAIGRHDPDGRVVPYMIPGFSDSFAYAKLGAICYGFAPVKLSPEINFTRMYHGHDERIPREGFGWGLRVLYDLVRDFCAKR